ncbi:hypothetical protein [Lactiplantibacillus carotarum]|uniref:hypothetical protein n=1 Tax=Lactiplantibacillus carotarum TaxID=2993456 RepID=UPI00298F0636|nr:hypothetical protein [Lactiplantibacillus carotarum]
MIALGFLISVRINYRICRLNEIIARRENIAIPARQDIVINRFYCDWSSGHATWLWLYREGDVLRLDSEHRYLMCDSEYLGHDEFFYDQLNDEVIFERPTITEVTSEQFWQYFKQQTQQNSQRQVQVALARYHGDDNETWSPKRLYEVEVLFDHTVRIQADDQSWHHLTLQRQANSSESRVIYSNHDWTIFYEELFAKNVADLTQYDVGRKRQSQ